MVARLVLSADGLQSVLGLHRFWFGKTCHCCGILSVDDVGRQPLQFFLQFVGDCRSRWDDDGFVGSATLCHQSVTLQCHLAEQPVADVVAVESGMVDGQDAADKLRG